jgi:hypothetical protein
MTEQEGTLTFEMKHPGYENVCPPHEVRHVLHDVADATWPTLVDYFKDFLRGLGYIIPFSDDE